MEIELMNKRILIGGYYGGNNLGDDALLAAIIASLRKQSSNLKFIVASFDPESTREQFQVESVHWREITELAKSVQRSDLVLMGGGGLFQDYWGIEPQTYFRKTHGGITTYGTLLKLAHLFGKPCMLYAVGVGPLYSMEAREQTKEIFSLCTAATLRDQYSKELIEKIDGDVNSSNLIVTADPVFSLEPSQDDHKKVAELISQYPRVAGSPLIAISLRYWEREIAMEQWTSSLAAQLDVFIQTYNAQVVLTPFQINAESYFTDDLALNRVIADKISNPQNIFLIEKILSAAEIQALFRQCDLVVAMRLHAAILALNVATPMIALSYDPKVQSLMNENGLGAFVLSLNDHEQFGEYLGRAWQEREFTKKHIQSILPSIRLKAERNAEIAIQLLNTPGHMPKIEEVFEFVLERLEQMQGMDEETLEIKASLHAAQEKTDMLSLENTMLKTRLQEMENSRGWKALERLRGIYRKITGFYKK
jgi:polysaccharide pyruvyl transferase CsaB